MNHLKATIPFVALVLALLTGCTTVNETGRKQLMFITPDQEAQMGVQAFSQMKTSEKISADPAANARLQRIGRRIATAVGGELPSAQWEFVVFDAPQTLNAFALPGGKVGFYSGLMNLAGQSDDEIAIVMGHEIAHVTCRHGGERQSQAILAGLGGAAIQLGARNSDNRDLYLLAYGSVSTLGILKYSRDHESEADTVGLRYAARAGYDPRAAVTFWRKMEAANSGPSVPRFLSTHPPAQDRIANLSQLAPGLMATYEQAKRNYEGGVPAPVPPTASALATVATPAVRPTTPVPASAPAATNSPVVGRPAPSATPAAKPTREKAELDRFLGR
jgi:metalloendopeptidase OMA1, mitochondrial